MTRTGAQYLTDLATHPRSVWIGSTEVRDPATHPAFAGTARSIAGLYDLTNEDGSALREESAASSAATPLVAYGIARNGADLARKHAAYDAWARYSYGFLGRTPDYMAAGIAGFASRPEAFKRDSFDGSGNVTALHERLRAADGFAGFTITNPGTDRSRPIGAQPAGAGLVMRVERETEDGLVLSGAKTIGTGAVFADEIIVGTIEPLREEDLDYAFTVALDPSTPGVRLISRASYEVAASSPEDSPLSHRFDENDALLVCQQVKVPWERVLTYRDVAATGAIWWGTPAYTNMAHQAAVRFAAKVEFLAGLALVVAEETGADRNPSVRADVGRLVGHAHVARAIALGAEAAFQTDPDDNGAVRVNQGIVFAQRQFAAEAYPQVLHTLRMLCGGGLVQLPGSLHDLSAPVVGELLTTYSRTTAQDASDRIRLMKLVWDVTGSEFATRHAHYEQFYQGAPHVYLNQAAGTPQAAALADYARGALIRR